MSTTTTTPAAPAAAALKPARSFSVTLHGADGAVLRLMAVRKSDGSATTYAVHIRKVNGKKTSDRGASEQHASFDKAKAALGKLVTAASARGWTRSERRGGFVPRPDAFTVANLPAAAAEKSSKGGRK